MSYLLSERNFRRNEQNLALIVRQYPVTTILPVTPPITQTEILARNLRYAGRSLMSSQWATTLVDYAKFLQVWDDIVISTTVRPGYVVAGSEATVRSMGGSMIEPLVDTPQQVLPVVKLVEPTEDLMKAIMVLHHYRYLTEPSTIVCEDPEIIVKCAGAYDIAVKRDGNTYTIL